MPPTNVHELVSLIRRHPVWADASDAGLRLLASGARIVDISRGQVFCVEGQASTEVFLLLTGAVRIYFPAKKTRAEVTVSLLSAPGSFGDVACLTGSGYTANVEGLTTSRAIAVAATPFFAALQQEPKACFRQYGDVVRRFAGAVEVERSAYVSTVEERVVALLLAYAKHGGVEGDGALLVEGLSQDDLAQQAGSNRRSIVRVMETLYASGGLERRGRRYAITDEQKLVAAVKGDVPNLVTSSR